MLLLSLFATHNWFPSHNVEHGLFPTGIVAITSSVSGLICCTLLLCSLATQSLFPSHEIDTVTWPQGMFQFSWELIKQKIPKTEIWKSNRAAFPMCWNLPNLLQFYCKPGRNYGHSRLYRHFLPPPVYCVDTIDPDTWCRQNSWYLLKRRLCVRDAPGVLPVGVRESRAPVCWG